MKARFLVAILLLLVFAGGVASAQSYQIRVTNNTNLRASHSLDSAVITSARAGSTLQVVGQHNRWLNISRDGGSYWMAGWVGYTRVDAEAAAPPADIDNCCFVDRQCQTDQQWTDGYWAYQNKQCSAPATTVSDMSPAPETATSATDMNNCCFLGWNCQSDKDWERGYRDFQVGKCEHQVSIEGSDGFKTMLYEALKLLREQSPHWYVYIINALPKIREVAGSQLWVYTYRGEVEWGRDYNIWMRQEYDLVAGALAHEACHVYNARSGQFHIDDELGDERACVQIEIQVLQEIGSDPRDIRDQQNLLANMHKPECQWWHNDEHSRVADHCWE